MSEQTRPTPVDFTKIGANGGAMGVRLGSAPPYMFQRDIAAALPMLLHNTVATTQLAFDAEDTDAMEALDTIIQMCSLTYGEFRKDNASGLACLSRLVQYVYESKNPKVKDVYALFCHMFLISVYTMLFCSKTLAIQSPESITKEGYDFAALNSLLCQLPDEDRKHFVRKFREECILPSDLDAGRLGRATEDFLAFIRKNQELRRQNAATTDKPA